MRLYVCDSNNQYTLAPKNVVFKEAKRLGKQKLACKTFVNNSDSAMEAIGAQFLGLENEVIGCLFLNAQLKVLGWEILFSGTVDTAMLYPRLLVKKVLEYNAVKIILAHNHPSGASYPSQQDKTLTGMVMQSLDSINVELMDHLIIGDHVSSMADNGDIAVIRARISKSKYSHSIDN